MDITQLRNEIDKLDEQLVSLFNERMDIAAEIAQYKKANAVPVYDGKREREKLNAIAAMLPEDKRGYIEELYTLIFKLSRDYQEKLMADEVRDA